MASAWRHFDETDGLGGDASAFWGDADGSVWLGTSKGIAYLRVPSGRATGSPGDRSRADYLGCLRRPQHEFGRRHVGPVVAAIAECEIRGHDVRE